jgi:phage shock protein A
VLWQSLVERAKSRVDLLKNAVEREQWITDLEQELKQVREAAAAEKKRLEDEHAEEKRKAIEATAQFNTVSIGWSNLRVDDLVQQQGGLFVVC